MNEAVKQTFGSGSGKDLSTEQSQPSVTEAQATATTAQSEGLLEKLFVGNAGLSRDPVYNWIMGFSAIALFFHTFYTPHGKISMTANSGRRRRRSEMDSETNMNSR